jgi:hypothetical protein
MEFLFGILAGAAGIIAIPYVFYALLLVCFFTVAWNVDDSKEGHGWGWATIGSAGLVYLASSYFGLTVDIIRNMPMIAVYGCVGYVVAGIVWSFAKWYFKLTNIRDTYQELKAKFIADLKIKGDFLVSPPTLEECQSKEEIQAREDAYTVISNFYKRITSSGLRNYGNISEKDLLKEPATTISQMIKPLANNHKSSITQWIAFWPISFVWTMINDPVRKIANYIFSRIKSVYARMSDSIFAGV